MLGLRIPKPNTFWKVALLIILLRAVAGPAGFVAYLIVALYGLRGHRQTIEALLLSWYLTMANGDVFGSVFGEAIGRFLVVFLLAAASIFRLKLSQVSHGMLATVVLGAYILLHSLLFSSFTVISLLKGGVWLLATLTAIASFASLRQSEFFLVGRHIYRFSALLVFFSIFAFIVTPAASLQPYGYLRGLLGHSQATGVLCGLIAVWAFARVVDKSREASFDLVIFVVSTWAVFQSGTRTGFLALLICIAATCLLGAFKGKAPVQRAMRGLQNPAYFLIFGGVVVLVLLSSGVLLSSLASFLLKTSSAGSLAEAYSSSRGELIEVMMENIRNDPFVGLGFGVASDPDDMVVQKIAGIPVSAVIEKGVTHIAVWEELGILGLMLTVCWLIIVMRASFRGALPQFALITSIFLQNLGEATLFSAGGMGLLQIILIGFCASRDREQASKSKKVLKTI